VHYLAVFFLVLGTGIWSGTALTDNHSFLSRNVIYLRLVGAVIKGSILSVPSISGIIHDLLFPCGAAAIVIALHTPRNAVEEQQVVEQSVWLVASLFVGYFCRLGNEHSNKRNFLSQRSFELSSSMLRAYRDAALEVVELSIPRRFCAPVLSSNVKRLQQRLKQQQKERKEQQMGKKNKDSSPTASDDNTSKNDDALAHVVAFEFSHAAVAFIDFDLDADSISSLQSTLQAVEALLELPCFARVLKIKTVGTALLVAVLPRSSGSGEWLNSSVRVPGASQSSLSRDSSAVGIESGSLVRTSSVLGKYDQLAASAASADDGSSDEMLLLQFALRAAVVAYKHDRVPVRVGLHSGPITGCVLGIQRLSFDVLGDAINTASRCETASRFGQLTLTKSAFDRLGADVSVPRIFAQQVAAAVKSDSNSNNTTRGGGSSASVSDVIERDMKGKGKVPVVVVTIPYDF
jgi:class 3 adenylate cyclase